MSELKLSDKIQDLPARQQIAIWIILSNFSTKDRTIFSTNDFCEKAEKYFLPDKSSNIGKITGGIFSSLVRNGMIKQLSGGRDAIWTVEEELHNNAEEYKKNIFPVVSYWDK